MGTVVRVVRRKGATAVVRCSENAMKEIEELKKLLELGKKEEAEK